MLGRGSDTAFGGSGGWVKGRGFNTAFGRSGGWV